MDRRNGMSNILPACLSKVEVTNNHYEDVEEDRRRLFSSNRYIYRQSSIKSSYL